MVGAIAIALSCVTLMMLHPPLWTLIALHALLFAALFAVAWMSERHVLAILAIPFYVAMLITAYSPSAWVAVRRLDAARDRRRAVPALRRLYRWRSARA